MGTSAASAPKRRGGHDASPMEEPDGLTPHARVTAMASTARLSTRKPALA